MSGRTDVIRTSSGSVVSNWLNSSVHENVRRSISSLAWRASVGREVDLPADRRSTRSRAACCAELGRARLVARRPAPASCVSLRE